MKANYSNTSKTAILLFAQSEDRESVSKPIAFQKSKNVLIWKKMNERVLKTIQKTKLQYFHSNETNQLGASFGEKLTNAILQLFNKGFEKVIVIGNDCPELKSHHLIETASRLSKNDFVLGANYNGGAYLIGVTKSALNLEDFKTIKWQTAAVFNELKILSQKNTLAVLPSFNDCNTASDLKKIVPKLSFLDRLKHVILLLFRNNAPINRYEIPFFTTKISSLNFNKGSPHSF
jgi:glycosyltransferase A (GT-A) superfamily protein (DUF2064 family)